MATLTSMFECKLQTAVDSAGETRLRQSLRQLDGILTIELEDAGLKIEYDIQRVRLKTILNTLKQAGVQLNESFVDVMRYTCKYLHDAQRLQQAETPLDFNADVQAIYIRLKQLAR